MDCPLCEEPVEQRDRDTRTLYTPDGPREAHRPCMLREVMGGIGHLIAHEYWCEQMHNPDAELTLRQSGLLVDAFYRIVGMPSAVSDLDSPV